MRLKLTNSVYLVGSGSSGIGLTDALDCNVYYIDCGSECILIDAGAGYNSSRLIAQINAVNPDHKPLSKLLLTHHHGDHAGGAFELSQYYHCLVHAPESEVPSIESGDEKVLGLDVAKNAGFYPSDYIFHPCPVDVSLSPGSRIQVGSVVIDVLEGSGHSLGGICYYLEIDQQKMLFCGDLLAFGGLISLQNIPGADLACYSRSVLALESLPVDCFFPGHGCFSLSGGQRHISIAASAFKQLGIPKNAI